MLRFITIIIGSKLLALALAFKYYNFFDKANRVMLWQIVVALLVEITGYTMTHAFHIYNSWIFNFYMLAELFFLSYVGTLLLNKKAGKQLLWVVTILCALIWGWNVYKEGIFLLASKSLVVNCFMFTILYLYILINRAFNVSAEIFSDPVTWICLSAIVFFGCHLPYAYLTTVMSHDYLKSKKVFSSGYILFALDMLRYLLLAVAFYIAGKQGEKELKTAAV